MVYGSCNQPGSNIIADRPSINQRKENLAQKEGGRGFLFLSLVVCLFVCFFPEQATPIMFL